MKTQILTLVIGFFVVACAHASPTKNTRRPGKTIKVQNKDPKLVLSDDETLYCILKEIESAQLEIDLSFLDARQVSSDLVPSYKLGQKLQSGKLLSKADIDFVNLIFSRYGLKKTSQPQASQVCLVFQAQRSVLENHNKNIEKMSILYQKLQRLLKKLKARKQIGRQLKFYDRRAESKKTRAVIKVLTAPCPFAS